MWDKLLNEIDGLSHYFFKESGTYENFKAYIVSHCLRDNRIYRGSACNVYGHYYPPAFNGSRNNVGGDMYEKYNF